MKGIKIKCPNCKQICFETTESFNPNVTPNGGMVRKLSNVPWEIDWLMASTTTAAEMVCPMCGVGQLAPSGRLTLVEPVPPFVEETFSIEVGDKEPEVKLTPLTPEIERLWDSNPSKSTAIDNRPPINLFFCDVCGKSCKNQLGLSSHKRSHAK